jgi:alpha-L-rhamnosidase
MKDAHLLSAGLSPDPFYSATRRLPEAPASALFGEMTAEAGACWLYAPGDLEGWLMARMREEAFHNCDDVAHPGTFPRPHPLVFFSHRWELAAVPATFPVTVWHSGNLRVDVNRRLVHRRDGAAAPEPAELDLAPFLQAGTNHIRLLVGSQSQPATVLLRGVDLVTDGTWLCETDGVRSFPVAALPAAGTEAFPHAEELPRVPLTVPVSAEGIADFGCVSMGRPQVDRSRLRGLGESVTEALQGPRAEQRDLAEDARDRAFRYVAVEPGAAQLTAELSLHPARYAGAFACSDPELTRIWLHAAATLRVCLRELTVDGLKRDRLPWAGDAYISTVANAVTFGEHGCIERTLAAVAPEAPEALPTNGIIDYDLHWLLSLHAQWLFAGHRPWLARLWPKVVEVLTALARREDERGFLRHEGTWLFIDWIEFDKSRPSAALQALYVQALQAAESLATALERPEFAGAVAARRAKLAQAVREHSAAFVSRHDGFLSELAGLVPAPASGEWAGLPASTPFMRYFEGLAHVRRGNAAAMLEDLRAYWGGMLREGASTFWEAYEASLTGDQHYPFYRRPFGKSLCHAWSSGPVALLSLELAGLRPLAPGWSSVSCHPPRIPLDWACATIPTPHGDLRWEYENGQFTLAVPRGIHLESSSATVLVSE